MNRFEKAGLGALLALALFGCSQQTGFLQGSWVLQGNDEVVMTFGSAGSANNIFYVSKENGEVTGYTIRGDELILKFANGATETFTRSSDMDEALADSTAFWTSDDGNELVFRRRIYWKDGQEPQQTLDVDEVEDGSDMTLIEEAAPDGVADEFTEGSVEGGQKYLATISVEDYGDIVVELDEGIAPVTVQNFVDLARSGFYDGLTFHRIMDGFMIQGGDPLGNGTGGSEETIKGEFSSNGFNNTLSHTAGVISMARSSDPDSASSQFFIVDEDSPFLDGEYAAFGRVVEGMDIVHKIADDAKPTDGNGTIEAADQPVITSVTVVEE